MLVLLLELISLGANHNSLIIIQLNQATSLLFPPRVDSDSILLNSWMDQLGDIRVGLMEYISMYHNPNHPKAKRSEITTKFC